MSPVLTHSFPTSLSSDPYPDVTGLWAAQAWKSFRRAIFQAQFVLALFGVCALAAVLLIGRLLIRVGPGEAYMAVWPLLIIQIIAVTLTLHGAPSRSALLAMGRQLQVLSIVFFGTLVFHSSELFLIPSIDRKSTRLNSSH